MNPDAALFFRDVASYVFTTESGGNRAQALAQASAIFVVAQHTKKPPWRREEQSQSRRQTVEQVHAEVWTILNVCMTGSSPASGFELATGNGELLIIRA